MSGQLAFYDTSSKQVSVYRYEKPLKVAIRDESKGVTFKFSGPADSDHATKAMKIAGNIEKSSRH